MRKLANSLFHGIKSSTENQKGIKAVPFENQKGPIAIDLCALIAPHSFQQNTALFSNNAFVALN